MNLPPVDSWDPADFAREHFAGAAYFPDMLREAGADARRFIREAEPLPRLLAEVH